MDLRFERFAMKALWIIMTMVLKQAGDGADQARIEKWKRDYMNAGGGTVD